MLQVLRPGVRCLLCPTGAPCLKQQPVTCGWPTTPLRASPGPVSSTPPRYAPGALALLPLLATDGTATPVAQLRVALRGVGGVGRERGAHPARVQEPGSTHDGQRHEPQPPAMGRCGARGKAPPTRAVAMCQEVRGRVRCRADASRLAWLRLPPAHGAVVRACGWGASGSRVGGC